MSLKKQALSGVKWTGIQQLGTQIIAFIVSVILARLLTPEEFGLIAMITIIIGIGNALMNAGLASSLIRSKDLDEEDFSTVFYFNLIASLLLYGIIYISAPYIAQFYEQPILTRLVRWLALIIIINAFSVIQQTRLTKIMDFKTQAKVSIPALLLGGIIGIYMAYKGYGVWSLVAFNVAKAFFNSLFFWIYSKWHPILAFNVVKFKKHFHFGYKLALSGLLDTIYTNIYNIVIGKFFNAKQVGYYQRANSMQMYPVGIINGIMDRVTYPLFAQIQDDNQRLKSIYKKILQMNIFVLAPVLITAGVLAEPLFRFLFTEKWLPAVPYFRILILTGILYPLHSFNLNILKVKGRSDLFFKLEIIKKILITLVIIISIRYGIYGLLYGRVFVSITAFFINTHYSGKFINYTAGEQVKDILPILGIALLSGLLVLIILFFTNINSDILQLIIGSLLSLCFYLGFSYFFKLKPLNELILILKRK